MAVQTKEIVQRLYPARRRRARKKRIFRPRYYLERTARWAKRHAWKLSFVGAMVIVWIVAHIYYYNRLIDLEYNIQAAWAQVEAEQERRYNIQQDITRLVVGYAEHERDLMRKLTELRTGVREARSERAAHEAGRGAGSSSGSSSPAEAAPQGQTDPSQGAPAGSGDGSAVGLDVDDLSPSELNRIFPQIMLTAEQYPNLRLTENFQQWSQAIIDTETRIAEHIQVYNDSVNKYTTLLKQFPANIFGAVWGFEIYEFYLPERETIVFRPVKYRVEPIYRTDKPDDGVGSTAGKTASPRGRVLPSLRNRPRRAPGSQPDSATDSKPQPDVPKEASTPTAEGREQP